MYKKFTLNEICNTKTKFLDNLFNLYKSQNFTYLKEFLKKILIETNSIYFFEANEIVFRIQKNEFGIIFNDEKEKIQLCLNDEGINNLHNLLKDQKKISKLQDNNKTILESLFEEFIGTESMKTIINKPYIIYDIETIGGNFNNLKTVKFMLGYSFISSDDHNNGLIFKYISQENLKKFINFLLDFDGRIIGYNNIYFDNPVIIYSEGIEEDKINKLNQKSLDLFLFLRNLTGKRYGLNKVCTSLISLGKTLSSGKEGEDILKEYTNTQDPKLLTKVKNYCKNDVRMTLGLLLYLLKFQNLFIDGEDISYSIEEFENLASKEKNKNEDKKENIIHKTIFDY